MAGESPLLNRVQRAAALLDDEALASLANKGLLRRAKNDLQTRHPTLIEPTEDIVQIRVEDCTVGLAENMALSRCTCPASGTCRHILTAILFLRDMPVADATAGGASPSTTGDEVLEVTDEALRKWAGTAIVRRATQALAQGLSAEFDDATVLVVRFADWNVTCRWLPGSDLSGMICSCHAPCPCEHRVAAVLAYQVAREARQLSPGDGALEPSAGAPRSREEVLESVGDVLREMVSLGLSRLSGSTEARLRTLTVSAHGVDLPRMERMLHALADEVALSLRRDAQASSMALLATASRIEALRSALANPSPDLVGVHRSSYHRVGDIDLVGMGARQWRTRSGYAGVTVYFWDRSLKNWTTWSESRPVSVAGFDPASRYHQDGPWSGCDSPWHASRNVLRLLSVWRNRAGRLSGREATRALMMSETTRNETPPAITDWTELAVRAGRLFAGGLQDRTEQDEIVLLQPERWGPASFDAIRQELVQAVFDTAGRPLVLTLPHTPQTEKAIKILERHDPKTTWGLLGLLRLRQETLGIEPVAIHGDQLINLTLDGLPSTNVAAPASAIDDEEPEDGEPEAELITSTSPLGILLTQTSDQLEAIADGGVRSTRDLDGLRTLSHRCASLGLASIAQPIARLADELDQLRKSIEADAGAPAVTLLRAHYVVTLATAQEVVAGATASIL